MKNFIKLLFCMILVALSISLIYIGNGYNMYKTALKDMSIEEKIIDIKSKENYTKISELPQMYKDALI